MNQSISRSIDQESINQSINQSISRSIDQSPFQFSVGQWHSQTVVKSVLVFSGLGKVGEGRGLQPGGVMFV